MRNALPIALLLTLACTSTPSPTPTPSPSPTPTPTASATPPCNAGQALVNAVLWVQNAAEYRAAALGTYAAARRMLDVALADPTWTASTEQTGLVAGLPPAVVLDLDETAIDNTAFQTRSMRQGKTFSSEEWDKWSAEGNAGPVPGAPEFLAYARSRGVTPFYITNRDIEEEPGVRKNLAKLGYPVMEEDNVLLRGERPEWKSDKATRRAHVAQKYRILLLLGDDLNDFANAREKSVAERNAIIESSEAWWGTRWFMVPNPMYGSWERAVTGGSGSDCEQLGKKVNALRAE